jgi:two-component system alkaline phosphatase synthesis response regulator PhoP
MGNFIKILLVDDEEDVLEFLSYILKKEMFEVYTAKNGLEAIEKAKKYKPDLILLDRMMPDMDGIEACKILRADADFNDTKIVFITARNEEQMQIEGLEIGADDYIGKPIKSKLLVSKIRSLMRTSAKLSDKGSILSYKNIIVDKNKYLVFKDDVEIVLPRKEFELLFLLISKPDYVFRREEILDQVWGKEIVIGDRTIDVHVRKLREKIGEGMIKTIKGIGYKFIEQSV